jgi:hypothetical protein
LKHHLTALDQVKAIREITFLQDRLSFFEMSRHCASSEKRELRAIGPG